jgi:hypothetical protein
LRQVPTPIKEVFSGGGPPRACAAISATTIGGGADLAHLQRLLWTGQRLHGLQHPALLQAFCTGLHLRIVLAPGLGAAPGALAQRFADQQQAALVLGPPSGSVGLREPRRRARDAFADRHAQHL